jgi:hypothetical protein
MTKPNTENVVEHVVFKGANDTPTQLLRKAATWLKKIGSDPDQTHRPFDIIITIKHDGTWLVLDMYNRYKNVPYAEVDEDPEY